jgi:ligand-binding sensor domain-containing protein/signal transduction histidine kinase
MRYRLVLIYCMFLFCTAAVAQNPYRYFNKLSVQDGLSHNKVNCILQDQRGFIWIGTNDGLNRFDGKYFTVFRHLPDNASTISGNIITDMLQDENNVLWVATADGGITKYDYRLPPAGQFKQYKHIPNDSTSIPTNYIYKLIQDQFGYLWLATAGRSVIRFDRKTEKFLLPDIPGRTRTSLALALDAAGKLWVGRQGGGLLKVNTKDLSYHLDERYNNLYAGLPHTEVSSLFRDKENNIWFGSWDNVLYRFSHATQKETVFHSEKGNVNSFNNDEALAFAEDGSGNIWIAGRYYGLHIYDKAQQKFFNYRHDAALEGTIANNTVNCLFIDRKGLIWLGTDRGLSVHDPQQQAFVQRFLPTAKKDLTIYDFYKDENDDLLIGTDEGLFIQKNGADLFEHKPLFYKGTPLAVTKFFKDDDGTFYIGTDYSLFTYNRTSGAVELLPGTTKKDTVINKIIDSRVVSIIKDTIDNHPVLLVSPYGHYLAYYDLTDQRWISRLDTVKKIITRFNLKDNLIRGFYKLQDGSIRLATSRYGMGKWEPNVTPGAVYFSNNPSQKASISNNNVFDMAEDAKGNVWVSTYGGGLNYFNSGSNKFLHFPESKNLLEGLQPDAKGNVWMISNGNLEKYNPAAKSFSTFILPDIEKSGGVRGYIYKDNTGYMYAAGTNFFIRFQPGIITDNSTQPKTYFTDFKIFNTSYSNLLQGKKINLKYNQNYFTIEFAAPVFFSGEVQYSYMLEGFDKEWKDAGNRNEISYPNLEGGNYIFKVRAANKKGSQGKEEALLYIRIIPPFWKTVWFYLLCALVIAGAAYALYRYRINELLKRQDIRNKIAQDLHDSVGSTLSSISVYSQVAKIYNEQQKSADLKSTLEKISDASGEMISEISDTVWAINPRNDNMETMLQRMESFAKPLLASKEIKFHFEYDKTITQLNLEMTKRKNFYLIFKEAVNNTLKYSGCKNLHVAVIVRHHRVQLKIKDDGRGFDIAQMKLMAAKSLSGNGLNNMKRRASEMKGECLIESSPGAGTTVHLEFPVT